MSFDIVLQKHPPSHNDCEGGLSESGFTAVAGEVKGGFCQFGDSLLGVAGVGEWGCLI